MDDKCNRCDSGDPIFEDGMCADCYWEQADNDFDQLQDEYYE